MLGAIAITLGCGCGSEAEGPGGEQGGGGSAPTTTSTGGGGGDGGGGAGGSGGAGGVGCAADVTPEPGLVVTESGAVRGEADGETYAFKGIPYAAPPVGELRWRPPLPPACAEDEIDATAFGPQCLQKTSNGAEGSEDCLTLNVWAPATPPASPRAVMVFIHGGGNVSGTSGNGDEADPFLRGRPFVEQADVILVTINYRLGPLGFFAHPGLGAEDPNGSSGNYGLLDQIAALRWIRDNIGAFGGDPSQVMVFGESAGAIDSCALLASPLAQGLFSRVLMESGACVAQSIAERESTGLTMATTVGCTDDATAVDCLRALDGAAVVLAQPVYDATSMATMLDSLERLPFGPTVDGYVLPDAPIATLEAGGHHHVAFIAGSNADETEPTVNYFLSDAEYAQFVYDAFGQADGDQLLAMYSVAAYGNAHEAMTALSSDIKFTCPTRRAARAAAATQVEPVRRYLFTHALDSVLLQGLGAFHALELVFLFQHAGVPTYTFDAEEIALSQEMLGYWTRFAIDGDPNGAMAAAWPAFDTINEPYLALDTVITAESAYRTAECDLLDSLQP